MSQRHAHVRVSVSALCSLSLALLTACGTARTYDGPPRASDQVARVRCQQNGGDPFLRGLVGDIGDAINGYVPLEHLDSRVDAVDGRNFESKPDQVELLPGQHELALSAHDPKGLVALGGVLRADFVAGKEYEISVVHGNKVQLVFAVKEKGASAVLASSERAPEEYDPLGQTDWLAGYEIADAADRGRSVGVTWVPQGQRLSDCKELLEVARAPRADSSEIWPNNPAWRERWQEETPKGIRERTLRAHGEDWMAYSYSGTRPPRKEERHGVGVLLLRGDMQYVLCFERIGAPLASEELDLWQKRLLDAPLR